MTEGTFSAYYTTTLISCQHVFVFVIYPVSQVHARQGFRCFDICLHLRARFCTRVADGRRKPFSSKGLGIPVRSPSDGEKTAGEKLFADFSPPATRMHGSVRGGWAFMPVSGAAGDRPVALARVVAARPILPYVFPVPRRPRRHRRRARRARDAGRFHLAAAIDPC